MRDIPRGGIVLTQIRGLVSTKQKSQAVRYLIVGGCAYAIEVLVIYLSQKLGASPVLAVTISFWVGFAVSFFLQKIITFNDRRLHHRTLLPQIAAFAILVLFNYGFTVLLAKLFQDRISAVLIRTIAIAITTVWNYYLYKTRIFKTDTSPIY